MFVQLFSCSVRFSMAAMSHFVFIAVLAASVWTSSANIFLGKVPVHLQSNLELEHLLLTELESSLGNDHRTFTDKRLAAIKKAAEPIFTALPKNENGKLGSAATAYALYRVFLIRHAWFVTGLEPFKAMSTWNASSPTAVLDQRVPEFVSGLFDTPLTKGGFGVHELAVLAATIEHLVHKESLLRLNKAYESLSISLEDTVSDEEVDSVMDTYMSLYILGPLARNISKVSKKRVQGLRANITQLYPSFPETQQFLRDVRQSVGPKRDYLYYSDMAGLVEEVGDRYGRWQDYECRQIKDMLVEVEDPSAGGAGRVRMADFYNQYLNHGRWQFTESVEYLRLLGALDESNPENPRLIIANYVNGPSNCVASSSYYSVCCVNECDELLGHLESKIGGPDALPEQILSLVADLPSSTVPGNRTLSPWLVHRLQSVAEHHGGMIPLHGRLFGQWMHYAYPRECTFPHVLGTTRPQTAADFVRETRRDFAANKTEMQKYVSQAAPHQARVSEIGDIEDVVAMESAMWTMDEELVVHREVPAPPRSGIGSFVRAVAFIAAIGSGLLSLKRIVDPKLASVCHGNEKYFV